MRKYSAAFLVFLFSTLTVEGQNFSNGQAARAVLGQTNFTAGYPKPSQVILGGVSGLAYANGVLYVADSNRVAATPQDSRIMAFPTRQIPPLHDNLLNDNLTNTNCYLCGFPASFSLGQSTFTPTDTTNGFSVNRSQSGLANATGVATDGHYFAVADTDNNRVLIWNSVPTQMNQPADIVIGQTGFTTFKSPQTVDKFSLRGPQGVWIVNNKLFVADTQNHRILIWNTIPTQNNQGADLELGQPDFNHANQPAPSPNNPVAAANQLLNPTSVTSDGQRLYVSDLGFNRVLIWNTIPTTMDQNADVVLGQPDMTQTAANNSGICTGYPTGPFYECQTSLNYPRFVLSNGTKLFVADGGNDRVLIWNKIPTTNGTPADIVLGQQDFVQDVVSSASISIASTAIDNTGGVDLVPTPQSLAWDGTNLYVSDAYNRRVLVFTPGDNALPPNSVVNWASEIVRQEGIVAFAGVSGGAITANDTASITIAGTAYSYTEKTGDTVDDIAKGLVSAINSSNSNAGDPNATAIFKGSGTGTVYISSKGTSLGYDTITLSASTSNTANVAATTSGSYLSAGTAATGAIGMLVEINNGTNFSDQTVSATLDGVTPLPNTLGGTQVYMDGYACAILKVSPTQIVAQVPYGYGDRNSTSVYVRTVHNDGSVTATYAVPLYITGANPGIFNAPASPGQVRPWPVTMAYHQAGNPSATVDISGSVTAANTATITIAGVAYTYTVVAADTVDTIATNLVNLINATDQNVTAQFGGAFDRVLLIAKQPGAAGNGITVTASSSTNASITLTAYNATTCCVVTPNSLITPTNPAAPGELIQVSGVGLGAVDDLSHTALSTIQNGIPYHGPVSNSATNFVTATMGGSTAQVIRAGLPQGSYGIYDMQMIVPTTLTANTNTQLYVAQNAFISNTVTIPVGAPVVLGQTAPSTTIQELIDAPAVNATVSGTIGASGWALNSASTITGLNVAIDGNFLAAAAYGFPRPDVCTSYTNINCPGVGWYLAIDTTQFADGAHTISITAVSSNGQNYTTSQAFIIANNPIASTSNFHGSIDAPGLNYTFRGTSAFSGWATNNNSPVLGVSIYVDGAPQGAATYGTNRSDVCAVYTLPANCPNVGWYLQFDTNKLANGSHNLTAKAVSANGQTFAFSQPFQVANWNGQGSTHAVIDSPSASAGAFSGNLSVAGWALDDNSAVTAVTVAVDGVSYGNAAYGAARSDVCSALPNRPGCPNVGFNAFVDTTFLADGQHTLAVTVNPAAGQSSTYSRTFTVANQGAGVDPILSVIDAPANGATVSGTFAASGWAVATTDTVSTVSLMVDGKAFGNAVLGGVRIDVCSALNRPGCPNVGWNAFNLNSTLLSNGTHVLEATITTATGHRASVSSTFTVSNPVSGPGRIGFETPGSSSNPFLGLVLFKGWAVNDNTTVNSLSITIDGVPYGTATYGIVRPDVCTTYPNRKNCPGAGWSFGLDTTKLTDGAHTLGITENNADGSYYSSSQAFNVANYSTSNPMRIFIDAPLPTTATPVFGSIAMSGWALDDYSQLSSVNIAIDGVPVGSALYGLGRSDVCSVFTGRQGCPNVGWYFTYDTTQIPNGIHTLAVTGVTITGQTSTTSEQFSVAN